ncbi:MAG: dihydrofolate reductase [Clostridia bacterium]|nr:dihydrofolate reductase [Clostridia bacterium]
MIRAIVAVDKKWGIGKKNGLLFNLPLDMKFFRETTAGTTVCMGYNTLLSFPNSKPLPKRKNVVLCPEGIERDDAVMVHSLDDMLSVIANEEGDVFVIGGAMFYRTMLPYCQEVLVTKVDADGEAEVFYENLDMHPDFECVYEGEALETNGYIIKFTTYKNKNLKEI